MARQRSLKNKAVHLITELATVLLNPISDKPSQKPSPEDEPGAGRSQLESISEEGEGEGSVDSMEGPDTSSFTAFLYSLLKDDYFTAESEDENHDKVEPAASKAESEPESMNVVRESGEKKGLLYRGKQSIGKAMSYAARLAGFRNQALEKKTDSAPNTNDKNECQDDGRDSRVEQSNNEELSLADLPDMSEPSLLLSQKTRMKLYASFPPLVKGRKWVLLYRCWYMEAWDIAINSLQKKHAVSWRQFAGISIKLECHSESASIELMVLVVGDRGGAVFGGLIEAPLKPSKSRRYQGTNSTFVFSGVPGQPVIYHPTGANRYYTLCSPDFLALGGGPHFALYLDGDLLNGSSGASETYGNPCLACSENFEVKEVELWSFVYASRYEEMLASSQNEAPGICRW
ncbi:hypothetical protein Cgig2_002820 [Carnegiea gigantea]|uniref:Oxidation resistance protein 1 n=1 Tax=Carnegiea gigantea TaxID=171969 RepID=A0A9Q1KPS8_9CARY|nr:hypothetical protein Cgig2_002820 [Carnegiea gigantea]